LKELIPCSRVPVWEANIRSASQEIPRLKCNPKIHHRAHQNSILKVAHQIMYHCEAVCGKGKCKGKVVPVLFLLSTTT